MLLLTILASFGMFSLLLVLGVAIGYALGFKNDRTLKQQISKLKGTIKRQSESKQLRELTISELKEREDWDFRDKLAQLTGVQPTTPDAPTDDDPQSIGRTF